MSNDFQKDVETIRDKAVEKLRKWGRDQAATVVMREYLSEEGMFVKSNSKLGELLDERHRIAITAADPDVRRKAIKDIEEMATGNTKVTNVQNNQSNYFLDFVRGLKDE